MGLNSIIIFLFFILSLTIAQNYDCYPTTTPGPSSSLSCRRDIVIAIDGTPYMGSKENVYKELDFIEKMISNWTFGDNGVNIAFITYGFTGQMTFTQFFTSFNDCRISLESDRFTASSSSELRPTALADVIQFIQTVYGADNKYHPEELYAHRPGIEPRLIAFTSTNDTSDISNSVNWFNKLYDNNYDTVLCVAYSDTNLYGSIHTLQTINMEGFNQQRWDYLSENISSALCLHDSRFTPSPCPSTTTTPLTTPLATTPLPTGGPGPSGEEKSCNCKPEHLWLDVIVIIDNSKSMTKNGLEAVSAHVLTLFGAYTTLNQTLDQSIRLGIISVADNASVVATFDDIYTRDNAGNYLFTIPFESTRNGVNIEEAFQKASSILISQGAKRNNTKKVIILYTSAFTTHGFNDPVPIANQLTSSGVYIIGVQFVQQVGAPFIQNLTTICSPNMTFSNIQSFNPSQKELLNITIDALCWINCFCVNLWDENKNPFTVFPEYAQCIYMSDIDSGWTPATLGCSHITKGSFMTFMKTKQKYDYLLNLLASLPSSDGKGNLHLGITYNSTLQAYQYLDGGIMTTADYAPWDTGNGFPDSSKGICVSAYKAFGLNIYLRNIDCYNYFARYACELAPCDTENYCRTLDVF